MMDAGRHPNITLLAYSEVEEVSGYVGKFTVEIRKRARSVKEDVCTGCGLCQERCPTRVVDTAFEAGMGQRKAIYRPFSQAIPNVPIIDREHCLFFTRGRCKLCERVCPAGAIDYEQQDELLEVEVGAIIVATGFRMWDPSQLSQYAYGQSPNIITGLQFERLTNASGPTSGEIVTAEGKKPKRVAIIHCVGSRDEEAHAYCSRFCCMYSLKQAHQVKDKTGAEVYSIYMDMRTFGKDYEEFYQRIRDEGIIFIRGRPFQITEDPTTKELFIEVEDTMLGRVIEISVDMVVLATAIEPQPDADRIAALFGLSRTPDGFYAEAHPKLRPVETAMAGVFLAGCCQGPRDVPDTVAHAGAAALEVVRLFNQGEVTISPTVAEIDAAACTGCGECIPTCPYSAIARNSDRKAEVNAALCQGCGTCVATCPAGAITALHFTDEEIVAQIDGLLESLARM
jgi:heterodisulfide reductase subunit A